MKGTTFSRSMIVSLLCCFFALPAFGAILSPAVDGSIIDGLYWGAKDGIGDVANDYGTVLQVLNTVHWEERSVFEFRSPLGSVTSARLVLPLWVSHGPYPIRVDLYAYAGDGALSPPDFVAGSYVASLLYSNQTHLIFDVNDVLSNFSAAGIAYAGFVLRTEFSPILPNGPFVALTSTEAALDEYARREPPVLLINDIDGDGVDDSRDQCPDTPPTTPVNDFGCSLEQLCPCDGAWQSKQAYLRCVRRTVEDLQRSGAITKEQARAILHQASHSDCWR